MSIEDWKKIGYSDEQAKELERLSHISDDMGDIDAHVADKILQETMKKYEVEKENNIMNKNLGKNLTETLKEQATNFVNWTTVMTEVLKNRDELKKNIDVIKEIDSALTDLKKVSEECVKEYENTINS